MSEAAEDESKREKKALDIIRDWFTNSPSHGIRRISLTTSVVGRVIWSIIVLIFTSFMCFFIVTVFRKYIAEPTKINLTVRQDREPAYFPAITFCNLNPLRNTKDLDRNPSRPLRFNDTDRDGRQRLDEYMHGHLTEWAHRRRPTLFKFGYTLNDLLIQCTFNGRQCHRNLTPFFHSNYGNCFTFDSDLHVSDVEPNVTARSWTAREEVEDDSYQLFLELFLHQNDYIPYLDDRAAFRLFIHRKNEIPVLSQNSLFLPPKTYTKLIFSQRVIDFSRRCRNDFTPDMRELFGPTTVRYSQGLCLKLCEFRAIEKECQCIDRLFLVFFQFFNGNRTASINTTNSCGPRNPCYFHRRRLDPTRQCPQCLPECQLVQYTVQSSYADYPNVRSASKVTERIERFLKGINVTSYADKSTKGGNRNEVLLNEIVAVGISASPYATETLTESSMYTWVDLISSIGGQTGLWIGVSLINFVELAELLLLLVHHLGKVIYRGIRKQCKRCQRRLTTASAAVEQ